MNATLLMPIREYRLNGQRVLLHYSPDFYRQIGEALGGETVVTASDVLATTRAYPDRFIRIDIKRVKEDFATFRRLPAISEHFIVVNWNVLALRPLFKCDKCGNFYANKEFAIACACSKNKEVKNKK